MAADQDIKHMRGLAGEYRVCSELLRRGVSASVTMGNAKGVDIVARGTGRRIAVVEVKTTDQPNRSVTGFYQKYRTTDGEHPDFWVLCVLDTTGDDQFYVLSHDEMAQAQADVNWPGQNLAYDERVARAKGGVDNVRPVQLSQHLGCWDKIRDFLNPGSA